MLIRAISDKNRKIHIDTERIDAHVARWKPGTRFKIEIVRVQKTVSSPMRKYFFGVVLPMFCEAYGYDPDEHLTVHRHCKCTFFGVKPDDHGIYRDKDIPSVFSDVSDKDIEIKQKYIDWIKRKAAEEGVYIPDPGEI